MTDEKPSFKQSLSEYANDTNFHGVKYVFHSANYCTRFVWFVLVVGMSGALSYQMYDRITYYLSWPVSVNIDIVENDEGDMGFPAVTICNTNSFRLSDAYWHGLYDDITQFYDKKYWLVSNSSMHLKEMINLMGHSMSGSLVSATYEGENLADLCNFTEVLTDYGRCFSFNLQKDYDVPVKGTGIAFGLRLLMNLETYQYMAGDHTSAGLRILVHDKNEVPRVKDLGISVPALMSAVVDVKKKEIRGLEKPYGKCVKNAEQEANCVRKCETKRVASRCLCIPFYYSEGDIYMPYCNITSHNDCFMYGLADERRSGRCETSCPQPCNSYRFAPRISYTALSSFMAKNLVGNVDNDTRDHYASARIASHSTDRLTKKDDFNKVYFLKSNLSQINYITSKNIAYYADKDKFFLTGLVDGLKHIERYLSTARKNYLKYSGIDRIETMILTPMVSFGYSLEGEIHENFNKLSLIMYEGDKKNMERPYSVVRGIVSDMTRSIRAAKREFTTIVENLELKTKDTKFIFPSEQVKNITGRMKELVSNFSNSRDQLVNLRNEFVEKLSAYTEKPYKPRSTWKDFEISFREQFKLLIDKLKLSGQEMYFKLESVLVSLSDLISEVTTSRRNIDSAAGKLQDTVYDLSDALVLSLDEDGYDIVAFRNKSKTVEALIGTWLNNDETLTSILDVSNNIEMIDGFCLDYTDNLAEISSNEMKTVTNKATELNAIVSAAKKTIQTLERKVPESKMISYEIVKNELKGAKILKTETIKLRSELDKSRRALVKSCNILNENMKSFQKSIEINEQFVRDNYVYISVFFRTLDVEVLVKSKSYSWFALVCDLGGTAGLYLGASLLAIVELIYFLGGQAFVCRSNTKHTKKANGENVKNSII